MAFDIRLPNINALSEREQLLQIKSYLYQFAEQMKWALDTIDSGTERISFSVSRREGASQTETEQNNEASFDSIKGLIIKSADIVNAYYDEFKKKLNSEYFAESDFGTFINQATLDIEANAKNITERYHEISKILTDIDARVKSVDTSAYIRSGYLYEVDGVPIYGLEVGQHTKTDDGVEEFNRYARFTANRLSFFDKNDTEIAWISDYVLHITEAEIETLTLGKKETGRYKIDTSYGLAYKWLD